MRADAEENKAAIIKAAWGLFATQGPEVSRRTLAKAAGVGVGTLYRHFPEAEDLYVATLVYVAEQVIEAFDVREESWQSAEVATATWEATIKNVYHLRIGAIGTSLIPHLVTQERTPKLLEQTLERLLARLGEFLALGRTWQLVRDDLTPIEFHMAMATISRPLSEHAEELAPERAKKLLDAYIRGIRPDR